MSFAYYRYRFIHWLFQWKQDEENDIAFVVCNCLVFLKYKEHTIIQWNGASMKSAPKYLIG